MPETVQCGQCNLTVSLQETRRGKTGRRYCRHCVAELWPRRRAPEAYGEIEPSALPDAPSSATPDAPSSALTLTDIQVLRAAIAWTRLTMVGYAILFLAGLGGVVWFASRLVASFSGSSPSAVAASLAGYAPSEPAHWQIDARPFAPDWRAQFTKDAHQVQLCADRLRELHAAHPAGEWIRAYHDHVDALEVRIQGAMEHYGLAARPIIDPERLQYASLEAAATVLHSVAIDMLNREPDPWFWYTWHYAAALEGFSAPPPGAE